MRCPDHPGVETNLACGRCGRPICPQCMVETPVGMRCPTCARKRRLPTYDVSPRHYLIASGVGLAVAAACGIIWAFIPLGGFFSILIALAVGLAIGEAVSRSINRKRGIGLQVIGGAAMVASYAISNLYHMAYAASLYGLLALAAGIVVVVLRLR